MIVVTNYLIAFANSP